MTNWTDPIIHWNQLPGTEVKRLLATWGMDEKAIAKYDAKHGFAPTPLKVPVPIKAHVSNTANPVDFPKPEAKKVPAKKAAPAKPVARQKHTGVDGEVKFVEHRNLFVGFWGDRVVVTKRTEAACVEFLKALQTQGE
jgi:hypothetical protein